MNPIGKKVLELFSSWSFRDFEADSPGAYASAEEVAEFDAKVRNALTAEYRSVMRPVRDVRTNGEGLEVKVTVRAGLLELRKLRSHPAFRRTYTCASCTKSATDRGYKAPRWCRCPSDMQRFIDKALATFSTKDDRRMLMLTLLQLRESVEHYYFYGDGRPAPKEQLSDPREREPMREAITITRERWKDDKSFEGSSVVEIKGTDSTSRLNTDLQAWDRPNAPSKQTQRLAFCGACATLGSSNPWFWVPRKRVDGQYERGPFALTAHCPVCTALETKPDLPPRTNIQWVVRRKWRHGVRVAEVTMFYRLRGRWVNGTTHELCSTELNDRMQQRWRMLKPLRVNA